MTSIVGLRQRRKRSQHSGAFRARFKEIPDILAHEFPGNLRYTEVHPDRERYVKVLMEAAFETRRLVKRLLKRTSEEMA
jgi:hypothetical protein